MRSPAIPIALTLTALAASCAPHGTPPAAAPAHTPDPPSPHLSGLARLVGGEWAMVTDSGPGMRDRWTWGVGNQSLRLMTHGASAAGEPWRAVQTIYWHPIQKQLRILGFNPFSESVEEGALTIIPAGTQAIYDLYQVRNRRLIMQRRTFTTPDRKHVELLEGRARGSEPTFEPFVAWDYIRTAADQPIPPLTKAQTPPFPARLAPLEFLHGRTWQSASTPSGAWATASTRIVVDWIPYADILTARIDLTDSAGISTPFADLTLYRHTGTGNLRCFAISRTGDLYEGDLTVNSDGSIDGNLTMSSESGSIPLHLRLDREMGAVEAVGVGAVVGVVGCRLQIWSITAGQRTLLFGARHEPTPSKPNAPSKS